MNFDDYEHLPTPSPATNMMAGAAAGVLEHCVMYPMDSIKVISRDICEFFGGVKCAGWWMVNESNVSNGSIGLSVLWNVKNNEICYDITREQKTVIKTMAHNLKTVIKIEWKK